MKSDNPANFPASDAARFSQPRKRAFVGTLFDEHAASLVKYLTARFKNREEAQEVAQEAWLRIFRLEQPEALVNPKAFLFQTASNLAIDRLRRAALEQRHAALGSGEAKAADVMESVSFEEELNAVTAALAELPLKCRQAFVMHRTSGFSYPVIADQLGVSTSMVEKYIIQTLKHFRNTLEQIDR